MPEDKHEEIKTLISWRAPLRVFKRRDTKHFKNLILTVFVICLVLIFLKEFLLVGVILALLFVGYLSSTIEPPELEHKITTQGLTSAGHTYLWGDLREFWLSKKDGRTLLNIDTNLRLPGRLFMVVEDKNVEEVKRLLSKYIPFRERQKVSWLDRLTEYAGRRLALG